MAYLLIKRGKFLKGHSYATGTDYRFSWTSDESKARRFGDGERADLMASITGGHFVYRKNTRAELKAIGRESQQIKDRGFRPKTIHDRINARA